jgi:hypothetical protein
MNKKISYLITFIIISILLSSCNFNFQFNSKKPNNYYYTNLLAECISKEVSYKCTAINTSFYNEIEISQNDKNTINNMFKKLNSKSFINKPNNLPDKPKYRLMFIFNDAKYFMDIYNENIISIYPWDGKLEKDYIDLSNIPLSYNINGLCEYLFNK